MRPTTPDENFVSRLTKAIIGAIALVVCFSQLVSAQPTHVQSTKNGGTGLGSLAVSFGTLPAVNGLIVVAASTWDPTAGEGDLPAGSVTDNQGNSYTRATIAVTPGGQARVAIFYAIATTSGGTFTVTANPVGTGADMQVAIHEYSGNVTSGVLDVAVSTNGTSAAPNSGPITTTAPLTLIFGAMTEDNDNTMSPGATFTQRQEEESNFNMQCLNTEDKTAGVVGTYSADWTLSASGPWAGAVAAFKFHPPNPGGFGGRSFVKSTSVGTQTVAHGLGQVPKAIIFWVSSDTAGTFFTNYYTSIGFTDGTSAGSFSAAAAALNNQDLSNASRRMANKAITIVLWGETLIAEADLASWDATSFTLNWTTNDPTLARIHFIAIGGSGVSAKVVNWQAPTSAVCPPTCDKQVPGVGFEPDVVLHAYSGSGFTASPIPGTSQASAHIGMGAMTEAGDQWANMIRTIDNVDTTESNRGQQTDAAIYMFGTGVSVLKKASFVSMDTNGFTVNFTTTDAAASQIFSLALKGVSARGGNFTKVTAGVPQTVADVGFRPEVVLLTSIQDIAQAAPVVHARYGIGASDGTVEGSTAVQDTNGLVDPTNSSNDQIDKGDKVFIKVDNNTPTVNAEADLTGFFNGGFNLNWTTNDGVPTQILYLALGPKAEAKVLSGSYTGNGTAGRTINVGFVPDFVIVKGNTAQVAVMRTSTMGVNQAKEAFGSLTLLPDRIQDFDGVGGGRFIVGSNAQVNAAGVMYYWTAFQAGPGKMVVGSYTGDSGTSTPPLITGPPIDALGFSPELVFVVPAPAVSGAGYDAIHRSSAPNATGAFTFHDSAPITSTVTLGADGFTVGTDSHVNTTGTVYHWIAWNEVAGYMDVGYYQGNATDPRIIAGVGFESELLMLKRLEAGGVMHQRPASLAASDQDASLFFDTTGTLGFRIEKLLSDGFQVNNQWNTNATGGEFNYYAWKRQSQPFIITGDYTGEGDADQTIGQLGFDPDVVIVKGAGQIAVIRTSTMADGKRMTGATPQLANTITSLSAPGGGFTVGNSATLNLNALGVLYHLIAFRAAPGTMKVGTYQGTGAAGNAIRDVGFSPELVFIMRTGASAAIHGSTAFIASGGEEHTFTNSLGTAGWITSFDADGFTVATANGEVNLLNETYHYIAWNEVPGEMKVGSYAGGVPADDHDIPGVGFEPEYVIVKEINGEPAVHHPASLGRSIDSTLYFTATATAGDLIQKLQPDGFEVGANADVNEADTFVYYAWKRPSVSALTAVRLISFTAALQPNGNTLLRWRTGWEVDNLGFHVYREEGGRKTRLTRSLVAGSGLALGLGNESTAERAYAWWDDRPTGPGATYWLEDVDLNGKSTWHGPVAPAAGEGPEVSVKNSGSLRELARSLELNTGGGSRNGDGAEDREGSSSRRGRRKSRAVLPEADEDADRQTHDGKAHRRKPRFGPPRGSAAATALARQQALAAGPSVKIGVRAPGWYRVGQPELVAAGLNPDIDPRTLQLYVEGVEQAMIVRGEADGQFDAGDALEFYGTGVDTPFTDTRVYWVTADARRGQRVVVADQRTRRPAWTTAAGPLAFPFTVERKDKFIFLAALLNGESDNFFGEPVFAEEVTPQTLTTPHVDFTAGTDAILEVTLQGVTDTADTPDHRVVVTLNDVELGEVVFDGREQGVGIFTVPHAMLVDGENTVTLVARGGEADVTLVDHLRLTYQHTHDADEDALAFTAEGQQVVTIRGFGQGPVRVFDLTQVRTPRELIGEVSTEGGAAAVTIRVPGAGVRSLMVLSDYRLESPVSVRANQPSGWHRAGQAGTHVIISHADFLDSLAPLKALRERQGHVGALVDVEDVYDEFSFGEKTPQALKDFLIRAKASWSKPPQFVVLAGNAVNDPRDYYGFGEPDFVPTKTVATAVIEAASDDWFVDSDGDSLADLAAIGRLSVRTAEEADTIVAKIIDYEQSGDADWSKHVLLLADENSDRGSDFDSSSMQLRGLLPAGYTSHQINSGSDSRTSARTELLHQVNQGQVLVNYIGHGSTDAWGTHADLLTPEDITSLWTNRSRLPLVVAMNCLNGYFNGLFPEESLAETLLRAPNGGAVAVWASSAVTDSTRQAKLNQQLYTLLFSGRARTIGEAVMGAKAVVSDQDIRRSWILFGDPAMRLKGMPQSSTVTEAQAPAMGAPADRQDSVSAGSTEPQGADSDRTSRSATEREVSFLRLVDYNGDGRDDIFLYVAETGNWSIVFGGTTGVAAASGHWPPHMQLFAASLNGDRFADMFLHSAESGEWLPALNNGDGSFKTQPSAWAPLGQARIGDFNGDRRDDVFVRDSDTGIWFQCLTGVKEGFACRPGGSLPQSNLLVSDFTGDALADVFSYDAATGHWSLGVNDGAGVFAHTSGEWSPGWTVRVANLNGDHRRDLLLVDPASGAWMQALTVRPGVFAYRRGQGPVGGDVHVLDFDGDGRDDLLHYNMVSGEWSVGLNVSPGELTYSGGLWQPGLTIAWGDLNGDQRADLVLHDPATGRWGRLTSRRPSGAAAQSGTWSIEWSIAGARD